MALGGSVRKIWTWIKDNAGPIHQRFDAQDRRIEEPAKDVSELRKFSERVSRNETRVDA